MRQELVFIYLLYGRRSDRNAGLVRLVGLGVVSPCHAGEVIPVEWFGAEVSIWCITANLQGIVSVGHCSRSPDIGLGGRGVFLLSDGVKWVGDVLCTPVWA